MISKNARNCEKIIKAHIFEATFNGYFDIIRLYLELGYDINILNENDENLLFVSIKSKNLGVAKFLYENGANIMITNKLGESLNDIVNKSNHHLIIEYFKNLPSREQSNESDRISLTPEKENAKEEENKNEFSSIISTSISPYQFSKSSNEIVKAKGKKIHKCNRRKKTIQINRVRNFTNLVFTQQESTRIQHSNYKYCSNI